MDNREVSVTLTVAVWNTVLSALGSRPYAEVASIIEAIKMQALKQLAEQPTEPDTKTED